MKISCKLAIGALSALLPVSLALGQQDYIGQFDVYTGYMYLNSPLISLGESGFHTQVGMSPAKWYTLGLDFSTGYGDTALVTSMLNSKTQAQIDSALSPIGVNPASIQLPLRSRSQTYSMGPQLNYRHFKKVTLFIHPDLGAIHEIATPMPDTLLTTLLVHEMLPSGRPKTDWVGFYGFGGGITVLPARHVGVKLHVDFVHDHLFPDILNGRNSVRLSVGPIFYMGKNLAEAK